jgi:predicted nucleic acid-binding protein
MTFAHIPPGVGVFFDANTLVYHFTNEPKFGAASTELIKRVEQGELQGFTSTHVLADVAHRLMTLEAINALGWAPTRVAAQLRRHHQEIPKLKVYLQAVARVPLLGIQVLPVSRPLVEAATVLSQQHELLTGDALVVSAMRHHGLANLASGDADFDRVPGLTRYAPV